MADLAIISMYDGPPEYKILSNLAYTPFELDGVFYQTAEGFWQSLNTDDPIQKMKIASYVDGLDAQQAGRRLPPHPHIFTYENRVYKVGTPDHWLLLERALRAKTVQNTEVQMALKLTGNRPLKHMYKNKYQTWRSGDSPALPAVEFEKKWTKIRTELLNGDPIELPPLPPSAWIHTTLDEN